jgi:hypothetical protein
MLIARSLDSRLRGNDESIVFLAYAGIADDQQPIVLLACDNPLLHSPPKASARVSYPIPLFLFIDQPELPLAAKPNCGIQPARFLGVEFPSRARSHRCAGSNLPDSANT